MKPIAKQMLGLRGGVVRRMVMGLLLLGVSHPLHAQRSDVPARIMLKDSTAAVDVLLTGRRGDTLHARLGENTTGSITYQVGDVRKLVISLPQDVMRQAEAMAATGDLDGAIKRLRPVVQPIIPYLDLPAEGVVEPSLRYAALLRREKSWSGAISIYRVLRGNPDPVVRQQAIGWLAYSHVRNAQNKEAMEYLATFDVDDPRHPGFIPGAVAGSLLQSAEDQTEAALDLAARASALARLEHELYPEATYLTARAYQRLGEKTSQAPVVKDVVLKKAGADTALPPAMLPEEFAAVAAHLFTRITTMFPSSPYAADAALQLTTMQQTATNTPSALSPPGDTP